MAGSPKSETNVKHGFESDPYLELDSRPSICDDITDKREVVKSGDSLYVNVSAFTRRTTGVRKGDQVLVTPVGEGFLVVPYNG